VNVFSIMACFVFLYIINILTLSVGTIAKLKNENITIFKLPYEKNSQGNYQIMFQICVLDKKFQGKKPTLYS